MSSLTMSLNENSIDNEQVQFEKIFRIHGIAAVFFLTLTISFLCGFQDSTVIPSTSFPISTNGPIGFPDLQLLENNSFNPCWFIVLFVFLAMLDHGAVTTLCYYQPNRVKKFLFEYKNNPLRWIEYSLSATLMFLSICILCGISNVHLWVVLGSSTCIGMLMGQVLEMMSANEFEKSNVISLLYWLSSCLIFIPWSVPLCYFGRGVHQLENSPTDENIPAFVYVALLGTLVCFMSFGVNSYLYHVLKKYEFYQAEYIYVILSFTAKFLLAVDVFGGLSAAKNS